MRTPSELNTAAEARSVEEGLRATVLPGGVIRVRSASYREKFYTVETAAHSDGTIDFVCTPYGRNAFRDDHLQALSGQPGVTPCLHCACAARSLLRRGLAALDAQGRWTVTDKARALQAPPVHEPRRERDESGVVHLVCPCGWRVNYAGTEAGAERSMDAHVEASKPVSPRDILANMGMRS